MDTRPYLSTQDIKDRLHWFNLHNDWSVFDDVPPDQQVSIMYPNQCRSLGATDEEYHAELVRLFGPAPLTKPTSKGIPPVANDNEFTEGDITFGGPLFQNMSEDVIEQFRALIREGKNPEEALKQVLPEGTEFQQASNDSDDAEDVLEEFRAPDTHELSVLIHGTDMVKKMATDGGGHVNHVVNSVMEFFKDDEKVKAAYRPELGAIEMSVPHYTDAAGIIRMPTLGALQFVCQLMLDTEDLHSFYRLNPDGTCFFYFPIIH